MKISIRTQVNRRVSRLLSRHFFIPPRVVRGQQDFKALGLNQMELNEVLLYLEQDFRISLPDQVTATITTISDAAAAVECQLRYRNYGREVFHA
jgi:acyl carrier protein